MANGTIEIDNYMSSDFDIDRYNCMGTDDGAFTDSHKIGYFNRWVNNCSELDARIYRLHIGDDLLACP